MRLNQVSSEVDKVDKVDFTQTNQVAVIDQSTLVLQPEATLPAAYMAVIILLTPPSGARSGDYPTLSLLGL
jgi:hypothetical protein